MAKVRNNMLVRGLSGAVGEQFVIRKDKAGRNHYQQHTHVR